MKQPIHFTYIPIVSSEPVVTKPSQDWRLAMQTDPSKPTPTRVPVPADIPKAIAGILRALELPDNTDDATLRAALEALLGANGANSPEAIAAFALRSGLSQREAEMLKTTPRMTMDGVVRYLTAKRNMRPRGGR